MPLALLLSPDDQAVSAITGVLEEMSVTCERPLDGVSAAQLLNSHAFDLVLVDCENLPAAKLIFDVCRRGKNGNNPVPIAIVDGRAGLPTAFRLGAELILTKPVAKDQARTTIRTAVSRVRKDVPAGDHSNVSAQAAAAAAGSSQATEFTSSPSNLVSTAAAGAHLATATASMRSPAVVKEDEIFAPVHSKPVIPLTPSDDPVLAELERTELEESESAKPQPAQDGKLSSQKVDSQNAESQNLDYKKESSRRTQVHDDDAAVKSDGTPVFASVGAHQQKRGPLVALMTLAIAGGGLYGAWMYEPGFRAIAQPQIDRVLALAGVATPAAHLPNSVKPPAQPDPTAAPSATSTPAPSDSATAQSTPSDSATGAPSAPLTASPAPSIAGASTAATGPAAAVPVPSSPSSVAVAGPKASGNTTTASTVIGKPADIKIDAAPATSNLSPSSTPLPAENTSIILSSQGAQKRLITGAAPKYPAEARTEAAEGTVVLKAVIDVAGKVAGLRLVEGNATLAPAAIQAVKQWRYRPYVRDGKSQPFQTIVIVDFQKP
ncbi:MAG TPA: TonB family protein [Terriglobales bacterium]|jgi:protein TonB|nr:TonB family protein [Terriglobales bacterium]